MDNSKEKTPPPELPKDSESADHPLQKSPSFLRRAIRNFLFSGIGTVASFVISFIFAGLTIRYLGVARAGYFIALEALTGFNTLIGDLGLGAPTVRRIAVLNSQKNFAVARSVAGSLTTINLISGVIIAVPIVIFFPHVLKWSKLDNIYQFDALWTTIFTMTSYILSQITSTCRGVYSGLERYDLMSTFDTGFGILSGLCGMVVLIIYPMMSSLAAVRLTIVLIRSFVDIIIVRRLLYGTLWPTWAWKEIRPMMHFGGWMYLDNISSLLFGKMSSLILTTFLGSSALPFYEVPQRLFRQVHSAIASQSRFLFPMLSSYADKTIDQIRRLEDRLRWFVAIGSGFIYTAIALVGPVILGMLINPAFAETVKIPLYLACIQGFFQSQDIVFHYGIWALGNGKPSSVVGVVQGVLVSVTSFVLIPRMGFLGASIAQLWVIATVGIFNIWILRIIKSSAHPLEWLKTLISPCAMIAVWLFIAMTMKFNYSSQLIFYVSVGIGAIIGFFISIAIEQLFFADKQRWDTLKRVVSVPLVRIFRGA